MKIEFDGVITDRMSKDGADKIMKAVGEHLDSDLFDSLRIARGKATDRAAYKLWLNIHGRMLSIWMAADMGCGYARV